MAVSLAENEASITSSSSEAEASEQASQQQQQQEDEDHASDLDSESSQSVDGWCDEVGFRGFVVEADKHIHSLFVAEGRILRLTSAALPADCSDDDKVSLLIRDPNIQRDIVITTLSAKAHHYSQQLDVCFLGEDVVEIKTVGSCDLHVSGVVSVNDDDELHADGMDYESEEMSEDVVEGEHGPTMIATSSDSEAADDFAYLEEDSFEDDSDDEDMLSDETAERHRQALIGKIEVVNSEDDANVQQNRAARANGRQSAPTKQQQAVKKRKVAAATDNESADKVKNKKQKKADKENINDQTSNKATQPTPSKAVKQAQSSNQQSVTCGECKKQCANEKALQQHQQAKHAVKA